MQQTPKPIKRSKELVPLSKDHHDGLLLCWKIRHGLDNNIDIKRVVDYVLHFYELELMPHFKQEEEWVFSLLPDNDVQKLEALAQHDILNGMYATLKKGDTEKEPLLRQFANQLNNHIRFEERELFPYIEAKADPGLFTESGRNINDLHEKHSCLVWNDEFWTVKK